MPRPPRPRSLPRPPSPRPGVPRSAPPSSSPLWSRLPRLRPRPRPRRSSSAATSRPDPAAPAPGPPPVVGPSSGPAAGDPPAVPAAVPGSVAAPPLPPELPPVLPPLPAALPSSRPFRCCSNRCRSDRRSGLTRCPGQWRGARVVGRAQGLPWWWGAIAAVRIVAACGQQDRRLPRLGARRRCQRCNQDLRRAEIAVGEVGRHRRPHGDGQHQPARDRRAPRPIRLPKPSTRTALRLPTGTTAVASRNGSSAEPLPASQPGAAATSELVRLASASSGSPTRRSAKLR